MNTKKKFPGLGDLDHVAQLADRIESLLACARASIGQSDVLLTNGASTQQIADTIDVARADLQKLAEVAIDAQDLIQARGVYGADVPQ